jgi:toxin ParE1/3/4
LKNIVVSEIAESDLLEIWLYAARDDLETADRLIDQISEKFSLLARTPKLGRARPDIDKSIRSFIVASYVIFYHESAKGIEIARVLHGSRDIASLLRPV